VSQGPAEEPGDDVALAETSEVPEESAALLSLITPTGDEVPGFSLANENDLQPPNASGEHPSKALEGVPFSVPVSVDEGDDQVLDLRGQRAMEEMERNNRRSKLGMIGLLAVSIVGIIFGVVLMSGSSTDEPSDVTTPVEVTPDALEVKATPVEPSTEAVVAGETPEAAVQGATSDAGNALVEAQDAGSEASDVSALGNTPKEASPSEGEGAAPAAGGGVNEVRDAGGSDTSKAVSPPKVNDKKADARQNGGRNGVTTKSGAGPSLRGSEPSAFESAMRTGRAPVKVKAATEVVKDVPETLSRAAVQQGFKKVGQSVQQCLDRYLKKSGGTPPAGKVKVVVTIKNSGSVSKVSVGQLASSTFGKCVLGKSSLWRFPVFSGPPIKVHRQFVLR